MTGDHDGQQVPVQEAEGPAERGEEIDRTTACAAMGRLVDLKLGRAQVHIDELREHLDRFMARRPYEIVVHIYPRVAEGSVRVRENANIPDSFSLIIADAIHNLRVTLDLVAYAIASRHGANERAIQFPFPNDSDGLDQLLRKTKIFRSVPAVEEAVRAIAPYPGRNETLSNLHKLDIRAKHRLPIVARSVPEISGEQVSKLSGVPVANGSIVFAGEAGGEFMRISIDMGSSRNERRVNRRAKPFVRETDVDAKFRLVFATGQPFEMQEVIDVLDRCLQEVGNAARSLIDAYASADPSPMQ